MGKIRLTWLGHSCFKLECGGHSAVIDPYREVTGYPVLKVEAGEAYKSHDHDDHGYLQAVTIVDEEGPSPFEVKTLACFHDDRTGTQRGENLITVFEAEGIKIAHFGDIGHSLDEETLNELRGLDAALIPVGGFFTINGTQAWEMAEKLDPKIIVPMHFRRDGRGYDVISGPEEFLDCVEGRPVIMSESSSVDITGENEKAVIVLSFTG